MGVILDSSVVITAERREETPHALMMRIQSICGDQEVALSSIGYTELVHGVYRKNTPRRMQISRMFVDKIARQVPVYPYTKEAAEIAAKIDAAQRVQGLSIPFADLLIGATALAHDFSVLTANLRHFRMIPELNVIPFE